MGSRFLNQGKGEGKMYAKGAGVYFSIHDARPGAGRAALVLLGVSESPWAETQLAPGLEVSQCVSDRPTSPSGHNRTVMSEQCFTMATSHDSRENVHAVRVSARAHHQSREAAGVFYCLVITEVRRGTLSRTGRKVAATLVADDDDNKQRRP